MKIATHITLVGFLAVACSAHALNPASGLYVGLLFGGSYEPSANFTFTNPTTNLPEAGKLGFTALVNMDLHAGYRICDSFRLEGQFLYNKNPYSFLRLGDVTIHNHNTSTGLRIDGGTTEGFLFGNGYYDFLGDGTSDTVPYVGFGVGYAYISNAVKFYNNEVLVANGRHAVTSTRPAGQMILGVSFFLDDFTSFAIDLRGLGTTTTTFTSPKNDPYNFNLQLASINFLFNGVFDFG